MENNNNSTDVKVAATNQSNHKSGLEAHMMLPIEAKILNHTTDQSFSDCIIKFTEDTHEWKDQKKRALAEALACHVEEQKQSSIKLTQAQSYESDPMSSSDDDQVNCYHRERRNKKITHVIPLSKSKFECLEAFGEYMVNNIIFDAGFRLVGQCNTDKLQHCYCPCAKLFDKLRGIFNVPRNTFTTCQTKPYSPSALLQHLEEKAYGMPFCDVHRIARKYILLLYQYFSDNNKVNSHYIYYSKEDNIQFFRKQFSRVDSGGKCYLIPNALWTQLDDKEAQLKLSRQKVSHKKPLPTGSATSIQGELKSRGSSVALISQRDTESSPKSSGSKRHNSTSNTAVSTLSTNKSSSCVSQEKSFSRFCDSRIPRRSRQHVNESARGKTSYRLPDPYNDIDSSRKSHHNHHGQQCNQFHYVHQSNQNLKEHNRTTFQSHNNFGYSSYDNRRQSTHKYNWRNWGRNDSYSQCLTNDRNNTFYGNNQFVRDHSPQEGRRHAGTEDGSGSRIFEPNVSRSTCNLQNDRVTKDINNSNHEHNHDGKFLIRLNEKNVMKDNKIEYYIEQQDDKNMKLVRLTNSNTMVMKESRYYVSMTPSNRSQHQVTPVPSTVSSITLCSQKTTSSSSSKRKSSDVKIDDDSKVRNNKLIKHNNVTAGPEQTKEKKKKVDRTKQRQRKHDKTISDSLVSKLVHSCQIDGIVLSKNFHLNLVDTSDGDKVLSKCRLFRCHLNRTNVIPGCIRSEDVSWIIIIPGKQNGKFKICSQNLKNAIIDQKENKNYPVNVSQLEKIPDNKLDKEISDYLVRVSHPAHEIVKSRVGLLPLVRAGIVPKETLDIKFTVPILDKTSMIVFECKIHNHRIIGGTVCNRNNIKMKQWELHPVRIPGKKIMLSTVELKDFVFRKVKGKEPPLMTIFSKNEFNQLSKTTDILNDGHGVSGETVQWKYSVCNKLRIPGYEAPSQSKEDEYCLAEPSAVLVENDYCVFCGCESRNYRYHTDAICKFVDNMNISEKKGSEKRGFRRLRNLVDERHKKLGAISPGGHFNLHFIQCSLCLSKSCIKCVEALHSKMEEDKTHADDKWYQSTKAIFTGRQSTVGFVGHCCEIKVSINSHQSKYQPKQSLPPVPPQPSVAPTFKAGLLHLPQLHLLIDSPIADYVDVHGLGKETHEDDQKPGLLHAVVASDIYAPPSKDRSTKLSEEKLVVEAPTIHNVMKKFFCVVECYLIDEEVKTKDMKYKHPNNDTLKGSVVLEQPSSFGVWIIIAKTKHESTHAHLVNARWSSDLSPSWRDDTKVQSFFRYALSKTPNAGLEVKRKGGSSGTTTYSNNNILRLLATNSAFPRKGKAVKLIKHDKYWKCYYPPSNREHNTVSAERSFVSFNYSQPQLGGQLDLDRTMLEQYRDLINTMTSAKYNTARVLSALSKRLRISIQKGAVDNALEQINTQTKCCNNVSCDTAINKSQHLLNLLALENKFSLVAYPVGYHYDVFKEKVASLENKICFSFSTFEGSYCGRGGDGQGRFVFAFLDWQNNSSGARRRSELATAAAAAVEEG